MDRNDYIYHTVMRKATEDEFISLEESDLIIVLEEKLGLTDDRMDEIMEYIYEDRPLPLSDDEKRTLREDRSNHPFELEIYHAVLHAALLSKEVTEEEGELLRVLESLLHVSREERNEMVAEVKDAIEHHRHRTLDERLSHFFGIE